MTVIRRSKTCNDRRYRFLRHMGAYMITPYFGRILLCALVFSASAYIVPAEADAAGEKPVPGQQASPAAVESSLDKEIRSVREQIASTPADAIFHARLGYLLLKKGVPDEAWLSFAEALKISPRSHAALTGEGIVLSRKGKFREAEQTLKAALVQNPNPVRAHYELGLVYEKLGDNEKAVQEYKEGISKYQQGRK